MTTQCENIDVVFNFVYATTRANVFAGAIRLLNFNINFGLGAQSSMMELEIAVDQCLSAGGVGIQIPDVGRAVNFLCPSSGFSFGGIIHTATYSESGGGFIFKFKIIDPRKLLDNFSILLKDYYCPIVGIPNFYNFAFAYEGGSKCPPSPAFETWPDVMNCANFGSSGPGNRSSKMGVSVKKVLENVQSNTNISILTTSGEDRLRFDATQIIQRLPQWSKIDSTSATLGAILDQAAEDSSCDIVTTLEGDTIFVWAIDRTVSINQSPVDEIIRQSKNSGTLISSETGAQEIYEPSNKVVIGDKVHYLAEIQSSRQNPFLMMLGYKQDGSVCYANNTNFWTEIDITPLAAIINQFAVAGRVPLTNTFRIREEEILAAGTLETWMVYARNPASLIRRIIDILGGDLRIQIAGLITDFINVGVDPRGPAVAIANFRNARSHLLNIPAGAINRQTVIALVSAWNWFSSWINENYGTQWLIPIDEFCVNPNDRNIIQGDGGPYLVSDTPTNEGYPSSTQGTRGNILGLSLLHGPDVIFRTADDKYSGFVRISRLHSFVTTGPVLNPGISFELKTFNLPQDSYVIEDDFVYIKASYAGEIHKINGKAYVLVNFPKINLVNDPGAGGAANLEIGNPGIRACQALLDAAGFARLTARADINSSVQSLNIFKLNTAAGRPDAMCLPMKSNIYTYGPWFSKGRVIGSTDIILDTSLNPWNHGGYANMNEIGQGMADQGLRNSNKEFSGSVTIAEPPGYNVGYFIRNYNIVLDSINVNYGSQGVTSTYSFRSQTPKFGEWGKAIAEGSLQSAQEVQAAKGFAMEIARKNFAGISNIQSAMEKAKFDQFIPDNRTNNASPMPFLIGFYNNNETNDDSTGGSPSSPTQPRPPLTCEEIKNADTSDKSGTPGSNSESMDGGKTIAKYLESSLYPSYDADAAYPEGDRFYNRGGISLDAWFTPVSIKGRNGKLSPYGKFTEPSQTSDPIYRSRPVMPPINKSKKLNIHQKYMNPIVSKKILTTWDDRKGSSTAGMQIFWITYGKSFADTTNFTKRDQEEDFGFMSLRGPLVLQSWGYDTEGKPIPNIIDSPKKAEEGTFNRNGTKNKFMTDWLSNPKTWPVGPIDLRWDRDRGVWVCPPQERIVVAQLLETLSPLGSAKASLLNPSANGKLFYDNYSIWGDNGENIAQSIQSLQITVYDFLKKEAPKGARIYAVNEDGKYIVIESSGPVKLSSTTDLDCETTVESDCPDSCGLKDCLTDLGSGPAVLGLNEENCLTLYPFTECEETTSEQPT